ncbi:MAG: dimethyl sulfoxide reductase anchor subunit [Bacteroidales bacterium]|nr:dimethyl sulfoxide reductase anchor subunit [Bacteroidales bacterium]
MKKNAFIFDSNKCVGCMACVVACTIENGTQTPLNWRVVNGHNMIKHPSLPVFHFSLACNHCNDSPCMENCPALAYSRDEKTGAIIHHAEACIGCTYCTWTCPYDAPKFNESTRIVEKCNFCIDRISEGQNPACVQACPVGALGFGTEEDVNTENHLTPGFVNAGIGPSIQLVPLRKEHKKPIIENIDAPKVDAERYQSYLPKQASKVELQNEWSLVLFTLAASGLIAWQAAGVTSQIPVSPILFIALAIVAIMLTTIHVGKKFRIWRFIINVKGSWLSREIVSFSAFFALGTLSLLMKQDILGLGSLLSFTNSKTVGIIAIAFGAFALISIDMVYHFLIRKDKLKIHSAMVWITAPLLFAWMANMPLAIAILSLLKGGLYVYRKLFFRKHKVADLPILSVIRMLALLLPIILLVVAPQISLWILLPAVFLGEITDRSEFYYESEARTPQGELTALFRKTSNNQSAE